MAVAGRRAVCQGLYGCTQVICVFPYALKAQGTAEFLPQYQAGQTEPWCAWEEEYYSKYSKNLVSSLISLPFLYCSTGRAIETEGRVAFIEFHRQR